MSQSWVECHLKILHILMHLGSWIHKKIIPFATNAGWLGHTFEEIQKLCPNSKVENGMNIVYTEDYRENQLVTSPDEIDNWIQKL